MSEIAPRYQVQGKPSEGKEVGQIMPTPEALAQVQTDDAKAYLRTDFSKAPRWFAQCLQGEHGAMLPGELIVVAAPPGGGKTSVMLSQLESFVEQGTRVLYFPLEMSPEEARLRWAASRLGFEWDQVAQGQWTALGWGSHALIEDELDAIRRIGTVQFPNEEQATIEGVERWVDWAVAEYKAQVVVIDHFHRLDFEGPASNYRVLVTKAVRVLKNMAKAKGIILLVAAQFNRSQDPMDPAMVHGHERIKECGAVAEEASLVLTLSRMLSKEFATKEALQEVRKRQRDVWRICQPSTMRVHCAKARRRDIAKVHDCILHLGHGRARDPVYGEFGYQSRNYDAFTSEETTG